MANITGGDKMAAALKKLAEKIGTSNKTLRVGFLENATYPVGSTKEIRAAYKKRNAKGATSPIAHALSGVSVAMVAAAQNFGTEHIPPRPFFTNMVLDKSPEWPAAIGNLLVTTNYDVDKTLMITGAAIRGQLQQAIRDTNAPPLAQSTIDRKGFDKPLIDTSHMINSVDYEVKY